MRIVIVTAAVSDLLLLLLAPTWALRHWVLTSALVGASRVEQIEDNVGAASNLQLSQQELADIDKIPSA
jgi:L-glyceraldehyde 3-phosphate reductase